MTVDLSNFHDMYCHMTCTSCHMTRTNCYIVAQNHSHTGLLSALHVRQYQEPKLFQGLELFTPALSTLEIVRHSLGSFSIQLVRLLPIIL